MGLSSKEVSIDDGLDWAMNLLKSNKRPRQQQQQQQQQRPPQLSCPRCNSTNTKFCYYNNYNREQPRHFCKSCKRHWTKGGTLRNVPIGGRRNNKRLKTTNTNKNNSNNNNNNNTGVIGDINFVPQRQSMPLAFEDQKNISEILYQALYQSPSLQTNYINSTFSGSSLCLPSLPNLPFTSSSFSNENPSLLSSSFIDRFESSNVCDYSGDSETAELITTTDAIATNPLWKLSNASSLMESDCNWNWDDLNTLISNDLKQPWNDFQTKVQGI